MVAAYLSGDEQCLPNLVNVVLCQIDMSNGIQLILTSIASNL
jgi:hypothetical protein